MTIEDMRFVLKIAEQGSVSRAAQALFITQPSLSQRLNKVERELGVRLFERKKIGEASLTEAGRLYCEECRHIVNHWGRLSKKLDSLKEMRTFSFGIAIRTGSADVSMLVNELSAVCPHVRLNFVDAANYQMEEMISRGALDFALIRMPSEEMGLHMRLLFDSFPCVRLRKGSPLLDKLRYTADGSAEYFDLTDLVDEPLVAAPASREHRTRAWLERLFAQIPGLHPNVKYTVPNIDMYEQYIKNGLASCVVPKRLENVTGVRLKKEQEISYPTYFVQSDKADGRIADILYDILYRQNNGK